MLYEYEGFKKKIKWSFKHLQPDLIFISTEDSFEEDRQRWSDALSLHQTRKLKQPFIIWK